MQGVNEMKPGDLIWQNRMPGGVCIFLGVVTKATSMHDPSFWTKQDEPVFKILHPTEGLIEDPSYYYSTIEEAEKYSRRRMRYEIEKAGYPVPDCLQREIEEDESR